MENFWSGFEKQANKLLHTTELLGLGTLGVPSVHELNDPETSAKDRRKAKYELAGLGILGIPSAAAAIKGAYNLLRHKAV